MARPKKQGMDYFPHNTDAVSDPKIDAMRTLYGNDGYAFYFILLEKIYKEGGQLDVSNKAILASVCKCIGISVEQFHIMILSAIDLSLFSKRYTHVPVIFSNGTSKVISRVNNERTGDRTRKTKRPDTSTLNSIPAENDRKTTGIRSLSGLKVKESKVKERKEGDFSLSLNEENVISGFTENKTVQDSITGFLEMREGKGKKTTKRAFQELLAKAKELSSSDRELAAIFDQSTVNCWADLFALKEELPDEPTEKINRPEPHHPPLWKLPGWEDMTPPEDDQKAEWKGEDELARKFGNGNSTT